MARNHPEHPFQRRVLVDRISSSHIIQSQLIGAVHGYMSEETMTPATLLVLSFNFTPQRRNARIKSVNITVQFHADDAYPIVSEIAPDGVFKVKMATTETAGLRSEVSIGDRAGMDFGQPFSAQRSSNVKLTGTKMLDPNNTAIWAIAEDPAVREGIPSSLETAILLERRTDDIFKAIIDVRVDVSGFSFQSLQNALLEAEDDPVIFDPKASPLLPNEKTDMNLDNLGSVDLLSLWGISSAQNIADPPQSKTLDQAFYLFSDEKAVETKLAEYEVESWFIDLWDNAQVADARPKFDRPLGRDNLNQYFSWTSETSNADQLAPDLQDSGEAQQGLQQPRRTHFCNLLAMQSSVSKLTTFTKLKGLFDKLPLEILFDFFNLPPDYLISRQHDRGGCQLLYDDEKLSKVYIIQTPFYSSGFWSLLLRTRLDSNVSGASVRQSGVIQVDAGVKLTDIFSKVRRLLEEHGHHQTLLPYQLFVSHYEATKEAIDAIQKKVDEVDDQLFKRLKEDSELADSGKLYRKLSMTLHECSMNLAELGRRRKFEEDLGKFLQKDLNDHGKLKFLVELYWKMSQSRESDIQSLPGKIESQRNVLYNLITQHDSYLQARLARESLRDSKAMKTLSILTILFLPGAFIATIFSTNMFDFASKNQQVRIYFAIVIPLTAVLMICWVLWLKNTPERADEESARQSQPAVAMKWLKGSKVD